MTDPSCADPHDFATPARRRLQNAPPLAGQVAERSVTFGGCCSGGRDEEPGDGGPRRRSCSLDDAQRCVSTSFSGIGGLLSPELLLEWPDRVPPAASAPRPGTCLAACCWIGAVMGLQSASRPD